MKSTGEKRVKLRLTIVSFFQFFVWGAWLITIANYWFGTKQWDGTQFGAIFSTMGIAAIFMPTIMGIIADRWINAEKLYSILHLLYSLTLFYLPQVDNPQTFFYIMLLAMGFYMPTLALSNSISYTTLVAKGYDVVKVFPPIRVWGTIGFITAMWVVNLTGNKATAYQFYIAGAAAMGLGLYALTLPICPPKNRKHQEKQSWTKTFGLDSFKLFANYKMAVFFIFCMFLGGALQLTNAYGDVFLDEFKFYPKYTDSFAIKYSTLIMSISQISETLFILAIPFFLKRFGIKKVMLIAMWAWVARFGLFAFGDPQTGLWMIILSCVVYGMAFDFFNISGSLFVEKSTAAHIRSAAQGLFMMMTNGFGAILGSLISGWVIDHYFTLEFFSVEELAAYLQTETMNSTLLQFIHSRGISILSDGLLSEHVLLKDWRGIWLAFAGYTLIVALLFSFLFKHKHDGNTD
ncbi:nucleoside permease [Sphingobacterium sp. SGR-19]|uniref:nucleoside permease n=1 Tax=Sphingobacterium sp. SGR-19 TaxID=2710886 RepID=UPI0013EA2EA3|nr:nucleoside permease [Sphingobacterium sp. SGR-19]NGM64930.1 nucleoside permease [Sphingobacterium sp. SGR-19]